MPYIKKISSSLIKSFLFFLMIVIFLTSLMPTLAQNFIKLNHVPDFDPAKITGNISLLNLIRAVRYTSKFHTDKFTIPNGFKLIDKIRDLDSGLQAAAYIFKNKLVIAIAGTQSDSGPSDFFADLGIFGHVVSSLIKNTETMIEAHNCIIRAQYSFAPTLLIHNQNIYLELEHKWLKRLKTESLKIPSYLSSLEKQITLADKFYDRVVKKYITINDINFTSLKSLEKMPIICGHSLGGFIGQIVCSRKKCIGHFFNGPGARFYNNTQIKNSIAWNHLRRGDLAGRFGRHIGNIVLYPNVKTPLILIPPVYMAKNHTMPLFIRDLENGIQGKKAQEK